MGRAGRACGEREKKDTARSGAQRTGRAGRAGEREREGPGLSKRRGLTISAYITA
jgi:hypothetical protein